MTGVVATAQSALNAMAASLAASANNLANYDTDGYKAERLNLQTAPDGQGVAVAGVSRDDAPGGLRPSSAAASPDAAGGDRADISETGLRLAETSNVDPVRESVAMLAASQGIGANLATIRTQDAMLGAILDLRV